MKRYLLIGLLLPFYLDASIVVKTLDPDAPSYQWNEANTQVIEEGTLQIELGDPEQLESGYLKLKVFNIASIIKSLELGEESLPMIIVDRAFSEEKNVLGSLFFVERNHKDWQLSRLKRKGAHCIASFKRTQENEYELSLQCSYLTRVGDFPYFNSFAVSKETPIPFKLELEREP